MVIILCLNEKCVLLLAPASSSDSSSSLEQEKYLQAILNSIPIYFKMNGNNTLSNRSLIGLSPGTHLVMSKTVKRSNFHIVWTVLL